jgi:thymidine phosphorylase
VTRLGAIAVGVAALHLGAGRATKDAAIDHAVGVVCHAKRGDRVTQGGPLADVHARDAAGADDAEQALLAAYEIGDTEPEERPIVLELIA